MHTCVHTRRKRVRERFVPRTHVYALCVCMRAQIFTQTIVEVYYQHMRSSLKYHKDPSFCCGDICKTILTLKNHQFSMYFAFCHSFAPPKSWIISEKLCFFWKLGSKMSQWTKRYLAQVIGCFLAPVIISNFFAAIPKHPVVKGNFKEFGYLWFVSCMYYL